MDATWQRLGEAAGTKASASTCCVSRPGSCRPASLARRVGGGLLRTRRVRARVAGRPGARGAPRRLRHPARPSTSTPSSRGRRGSSTSSSARGTRPDLGWLPRSGALRFRASSGLRGVSTTRGTARPSGPPLAYGEPAERPPNILNIDEVELEEHRGRFATAPLATKERSDQAGLPLGAAQAGSARLGAPLPLGERRRSSSCSKARGRSTSGRLLVRCGYRRGDRRRFPSVPATSSRDRRRRARQPLVPRRPERPDDADLRHAKAERHVLVSRSNKIAWRGLGVIRAHRGARSTTTASLTIG